MSALAWIAYAVFFGSVALCVGVLLLSHMWPKVGRVGLPLSIVGAVSGTVGLAERWVVSGHAPLFGTFENTYTAAWALFLAAAVLGLLRRERFEGVWRLVAPWGLMLLLWGTRYRKGPTPITISEQSLWVDVHVMFAWICFVALLVVTSAAIASLRGRHVLGATAEESETTQFKFLTVGFIAMTLMLATGSWYSYLLFGAFWRWEVVETLSLVAWLGYAMIVHARLFGRFTGRRFAIAILLVLPLLVLAYFIWSVYPNTFHYFDIPLVKPY